MSPRPRPAKISALVSDVDGTLVISGKPLKPSTIAAVARLRQAGIAFVMTSSRPPRGMLTLAEAMGLTTPIAGFNGGVIARPDLSVIEQHLLTPQTARRAIDFMVEHGADPWAFDAQRWMIRDPQGAYVDLERRTVGFDPTIVPDFGTEPEGIGKVVGASADFDRLAQSEIELRNLLGGEASVVRSQKYYLDVTHPDANKGAVVLALSRILGVPQTEIATIGDGENDVAMFEQGAFSIAMGNASPAVQGRADAVTDAIDEDGFAKAVDRILQ